VLRDPVDASATDPRGASAVVEAGLEPPPQWHGAVEAFDLAAELAQRKRWSPCERVIASVRRTAPPAVLKVVSSTFEPGR
jgi:hypothetical protein